MINSLNFFNKFSNEIMVIATSFLVIITGIYAWLTFRIMKETARARKDIFLPIISIEFIDSEMIIKNIGKGMAQKLQIQSSMGNNLPMYAVLCPNESKIMNIPRDNYIEIVYDDIFNRKCMTKVYLGTMTFQFVSPKR